MPCHQLTTLLKLTPGPTGLIALLCAVLTPVPGWADAYRYDARMAFLKAGELSLEMNRLGQQYEVTGEFQTSKAMSNYYTWNGVFAAVGQWQGHVPVTKAYMARTTGKDEDLKIVLTYEDGARVLEGAGGTFETVTKPGGIDLISALFFSPVCYEGGQVHDGEDTYQIRLRAQRAQRLNGGQDYYRGPVLSCDYTVVDYKQRKRRVIVSLANVQGNVMAVQVRAKIPVLPDAIFRLRMDQTHGTQIAAMD